MKHLKFLALATLLLALSACESMQQSVTDAYYDLQENGIPAISDTVKGKPLSERLVEKGACPVVEIAEDLGAFYDFGTARPGPSNLVSRVQLSQQNACSYGPKSVTVDVRLNFDDMIGPAGRQQTQDQPIFSYPYFVAIVAPGGKILAKEVFAVSMTFNPGTDRQSHIENLRQIIPVRNQDNGASHKIVVGFQLTKDQLAYNRVVINQRQREQAAQTLKERKLYNQRPAAPNTVSMDSPPAAATPGPIILSPQDDNKLNQ